MEDMLISLRIRQGINSIKKFPGTFSTIATQFLERLGREPMFAQHIDQLSRIIDEAKELHEIRTIIAHGVCDGNDLEGRVRFQKSKRREGWGAKSYLFEIDDLEQASKKMLDLADELLPIQLDIRQRFLRAEDGSLLTASQRHDDGEADRA